MPWQFLVVDGADASTVFPLPERGAIVIGRSHDDVDIVLNDLFIGRHHCQVEVTEEGTARVKHLYGAGGSFVNKVKIEHQHDLKEGDILRVGNTHMRLEPAAVAGPPAKAAQAARAAEAAAAAPPVKTPAAATDSIGRLQGKILGHYEIGETLAANACRAVYVAEDKKSNQTIVLRVFATDFPANPQELQRFAAVMKQVLPLRHDYLVSLLGVGKNGPFTWIAREHVVGESLADVLKRQAAAGKTRPKWQRGLRLAMEMGFVLEYLHRQRHRHGRICPPNILLESASRAAKLANLKLDEALAGSALGEKIRAGRQPAEVAYVSPEQATAGAFVDELSDIYSLGAVVYARVTGRPPFLGTTAEETLEQVRDAPLTPPRRVNPSIPEAFEAIIVKMLERRQEDRLASASALLGALEPFAAELEAGMSDSAG
ncbi:MAG: FHA domain-containing serine/threonine-protein kinase [Gemmataceae bacterium]